MTIGNLYIPTIPEWRAFFHGVRDRNATPAQYDNDDLQLAYDCGQEFGRWAFGGAA